VLITIMQAARQRKYRDTRKEAVAQTNFRKNLEFIVAENAKGTNPYVLVSALLPNAAACC
jgi:hypothetical protein